MANYEFHKLEQKDKESFDAWCTRVQHAAKTCDFSCAHNDCTVPKTLCRDRIVSGGLSDEISKHALKNQWGLDDLIKNGRQLEAASLGVQKMKRDSPLTARRVGGRRKPGKYSNKNQQQFEKQAYKPSKSKCVSCSSRVCQGGKKCPGTKIECFDCGKKGHFRGA